jgi:hypothetical protein
MIDLPSGSLSGCDSGITSSSTACLPRMNATGCILSVSFIPEGEFIIVDVPGETTTYFGYRDEQRHLLIIAEWYLVGAIVFQDIMSGRKNLVTNSPLGFGTLGQLPEGKRESGSSGGVYGKAVRCEGFSADTQNAQPAKIIVLRTLS